MADLGPGPPALIRLRITTEIARLQFSIASQELEKMEAVERAKKIDENIKASKLALAKEQENLEAFDNQKEGEE